MQKEKKRLDSRVPHLIQNNVLLNHRSFIILVGDHSRSQIPTLHYLLSRQLIKQPSVLWMYKHELELSSHRKKRMKQLKREVQKGIREIDEENPFEIFATSTDIKYCYYKESDRVLGNTFNMLVLQDFEAITPNLLAKTIETVSGGGICVLLLKTMDSLKQLYTMSMDVHSRYRTQMHNDVVGRFNERFILSLGDCESCLVCDDELNVLPISAAKDVRVLESDIEPNNELKELKQSFEEVEIVKNVIENAKTVDQAKAVLQFIDIIAEKSFTSTCSLTAARGRGKSATLGLAVAASIAYGYSNIFVTSPTPENLKTLFEFILKGFDSLGYEEHLDYDVCVSSDPKFSKSVVRINVFRDHRQTIQWILPSDHAVLKQAELVVIDEAAAIPLPVVKKLLGNYLVLMASTINGYEGTGRALSLKLLKQLREDSVNNPKSDTEAVGRDGKEVKKGLGRTLREITLNEPIRYGKDDPVEKWLNKLLCLDCCTPKTKRLMTGCPHPSTCELYFVNRDTLFSYHPVSEMFLQSMMGLYVASHYKNSPNDLQLLSDAPGHLLFVLLAPTEKNSTTLPEPIVVVQLCLEGMIAKDSALAALSRGVRADGDLIPWVLSQQFQDDDFAALSGARVVRIATHPDYIGMGYGKRALQQLEAYYKGEIISLEEVKPSPPENIKREMESTKGSLKTEKIKVRDPEKMPPLFLKLSQRPPAEKLDWLGVSFGITMQLHKFWKNCGMKPVYLRQTCNELTGEHTCIMVKQLESDAGEKNWLSLFSLDFRSRFLQLLAYQFNSFSTKLVLSILDACGHDDSAITLSNSEEIYRIFSAFDLKRLESYSQNVLDYHVILDLVPILALQVASNKLVDCNLSAVQSAILFGIGLQKKGVEDLEKELELSVSQILAIFAKSIRKLSRSMATILENQIAATITSQTVTVKENEYSKDIGDDAEWDPTLKTLDEEQNEDAAKISEELRKDQRNLIETLNVSQYAIVTDEKDWHNAKPTDKSAILSVKNPNSTKLSKHQKSSKLVDSILGKKNDGINDPKGVLAKIKEKKRKQKEKNLAKRK